MTADVWSMTVEIVSGIDPGEVRRALSYLIDPDASHEVRGLPSGRSATVRGNDLDGAVRAVEALAEGKGTYVTLNPVRPDLTGAARVKDVTRRRNFLIDCDPRRPDRDSNATEGEKAAALRLAEAVRADLDARGWPKPLVIDSGNGWHLVYVVDLPADKLSQQLLSLCLKALQKAHGNEAADVDTKVHNASRITKLPGTWVRKGPHSEARPHRMARLVSVPAVLTPVPVELLQDLAGLGDHDEDAGHADTPDAPNGVDWTMRVGGGLEPNLSAYVRKAIEAECGRVATAPEGERNNTLNAAAFNLGQLLPLGAVGRPEIESALAFAARRAGLSEHETNATVRSGLAAGEKEPRQVAPKPGTNGHHANGTNGTAAARPAVPPPTERVTIRASQITPKAVRWLWAGRVPVGFITVFAGRTGLGKSFVTCDLAARITQGEDLPDGPSGMAGECRNVLFISEDPYEYVLAPRLLELGADLSRVSFLTWDAMAAYTLRDTEFLDRAFREAEDPALVVIDPPTNFLGDGVDEHKNSAVRSILMQLVQWIKDKDAACVMITHVNKSTGKGIDAINRVIGSVAWTTTARIAHSFAPDPNSPGGCLFVPMKSNLGQLPKGLAYRIRSTDTLATVEWTGEVDTTADEAMAAEAPAKGGGTRKVAATDWLTARFRERREWPSDDIHALARGAGLSRNAVFEAKKDLPVRAKKVTGGNGEVHWFWHAEDGWPPPETNRQPA